MSREEFETRRAGSTQSNADVRVAARGGDRETQSRLY